MPTVRLPSTALRIGELRDQRDAGEISEAEYQTQRLLAEAGNSFQTAFVVADAVTGLGSLGKLALRTENRALNVAGRVIGAVVDSVSDVILLTGSQIRPAPDFSGSFDTKYILGLATMDARMMIVTDIERLMTSADMELIDGATA